MGNTSRLKLDFLEDLFELNRELQLEGEKAIAHLPRKDLSSLDPSELMEGDVVYDITYIGREHVFPFYYITVVRDGGQADMYVLDSLMGEMSRERVTRKEVASRLLSSKDIVGKATDITRLLYMKGNSGEDAGVDYEDVRICNYTVLSKNDGSRYLLVTPDDAYGR